MDSVLPADGRRPARLALRYAPPKMSATLVTGLQRLRRYREARARSNARVHLQGNKIRAPRAKRGAILSSLVRCNDLYTDGWTSPDLMDAWVIGQFSIRSSQVRSSFRMSYSISHGDRFLQLSRLPVSHRCSTQKPCNGAAGSRATVLQQTQTSFTEPSRLWLPSRCAALANATSAPRSALASTHLLFRPMRTGAGQRGLTKARIARLMDRR